VPQEGAQAGGTSAETLVNGLVAGDAAADGPLVLANTDRMQQRGCLLARREPELMLECQRRQAPQLVRYAAVAGDGEEPQCERAIESVAAKEVANDRRGARGLPRQLVRHDRAELRR